MQKNVAYTIVKQLQPGRDATEKGPVPSPFPGIDPYLEGSQWVGAQVTFSVELARQRGAVLPYRYVARTVEIESAAEGARQIGVQVRDTAEHRLVTSIEVLSQSNKCGGGRQAYRAKRQRILLSTAHLIEIDLLRAGERVPVQRPLPDHPYFVLLSRADQRPLSDVWPIRLSDPLPGIPVPLLSGDADVPLDLQQAFTSVYDAFRYEVTMDYTRRPRCRCGPTRRRGRGKHLASRGVAMMCRRSRVVAW